MADFVKKPFFVPRKQVDLFDAFNEELIDEIVGQYVDIYKVSVDDSNVNMYGESTSGGTKIFESGFRVNCLINFSEPTTEMLEEFGSDVNTNVELYFHRNTLKDANFFPEIGDIVDWNGFYFEMNSVVEPQLIAGNPEFKHDIKVMAHRIRLSSLQIEDRPRQGECYMSRFKRRVGRNFRTRRIGTPTIDNNQGSAPVKLKPSLVSNSCGSTGQIEDYYGDCCFPYEMASNCIIDCDICCVNVCFGCPPACDCAGIPNGDNIICNDGSCGPPDSCPENASCCGSDQYTEECCYPPRPDCDTTWPQCHPANHWCNNDNDCCGDLRCDSHKCGCW